MQSLIDAPAVNVPFDPITDPHQGRLALACLKAEIVNLFVTHGQVQRLADFGPPSPLLNRLVLVPLHLHVTCVSEPMPDWFQVTCQEDGHDLVDLFHCPAGLAQLSVLHEALLEGLDVNEHDLILHTVFQASTDLVLIYAAGEAPGLRAWVATQREDFTFKGSVPCALPAEEGSFLLFRRVLPL